MGRAGGVTNNAVVGYDNSDWYDVLVDECKAIITEAVFNSRWALVEGYHQLGERIVNETNLDRKEVYGKKILQGLAKSIGVGERTLYYAVQFYDKYPSLDMLPDGKNISWNKIITKYLPAPKKLDTPPLPDGQWDVIYADPPWRYEFSKTDNRKIENHYPTMSLDEICELKVGELATTPDAVLFMWATSPKLEEALKVINSWGFTYRTCMVWIKDKIGMGYYARQQHELLLIAMRGSVPVPEPKNRVSSVLHSPRLEHSKKPENYYEIIERMYPEYKKIELFSRQERDGWDSWGNQV